MAKISNISFDDVTLKSGFWYDKRNLVSNVSLSAVKNKFMQTGRFDGFDFSKNVTPNIAYDSDMGKWIECAALLMRNDRKTFEKEEIFIDGLVEQMGKSQMPSGYLNSYYQRFKPNEIFKNRLDHELYNLGHLIEGAIEYHKSTGKRAFLDILLKYVDLVERVFVKEKTAGYYTCGHEEIELALYKLYKHTGDEKYLKLSEHFLFERGKHEEELYPNTYSNCDQTLPVYQLERAEGHCVMANYLYMAMADIAFERNDKKLQAVVENLFNDIVNGKMYITGGVGQSHYSECYTVPYDLDNIHAYNESCACISLLMFCLRMQKFGLNSAYADTIERILYNNLLSSISLDGKAFFYENPLEIDLKETYKDKLHHPAFVSHMPKTQRSEVMETSCCPPNIIRTIAKIGDVIYSVCNDGVVINQFISSAYSDGDMRVEISTNYPVSGVIKATFDNYKYNNIYIRKPDYVKDFCLTLNGQEVFTAVENGYIKVGVDGKGEIVLSFDISPVFVYANINVRWNAGKVAVMRGPVVYMAEGIDNGNGLHAIKLDTNAHLKEEFDDFCPFPTIIAHGERETSRSDLYSTTPPKSESTQVILRPYFTFANRGESDMAVYLRRK